MKRIVIDPITRIEGHLSVDVELDNGVVRTAHVRGDMFRGFERILRGRNPVDAIQLTQRICGVCPVSHGITSCRTLESAFGVEPSKNGVLLRNLILASNYLQSHILHFYILAAPDFVDIAEILNYTGSDETLLRLKAWTQGELSAGKDAPLPHHAAAPFFPRYQGGDMYLKGTDGNITLIAHYVKALDIRMKAHRMLTLFGGRMPHVIGLVPGGITQKPTPENIREFSQILDEVEQFVTTCYLPDIFSVVSAFPEYLSAGTFGNFLSYGEFPDCDAPRASYFPAGVIQGDSFPPFSAKNILEYVRYSRYSSGSGLHPSAGETEPQPDKPEAYSWMKAPRYREQPCEVGPLARVLIAYTRGNAEIKKEVDAVLAKCSAGVPVLKSVLGRHAARAIESVVLCRRMKEWLAQLDPAKPPRSTYQIVDASEGMGLAEAPRGALGHWIAVRNKVIDTYQCIVPTTWFCSPRDDTGVAGPVEQALTGTQVKDPGNPIEVVRVVRSFDPCIACAVHVLREKREVGQTLIC